jgi:hypothetical protein
MHESIRPVAGAIAPLALMGVRSFWPHNMIGREGHVVNQAPKLWLLPTVHQLFISHSIVASTRLLPTPIAA